MVAGVTDRRAAGGAGRDLVRELVVRELRLRYRRSLLGIAWSQLGAISTLAVLWFVFTQVVPLHIPNYAVFVFVGVLAWTWFNSAIQSGTGCIVESRDLVRRPGFPVGLLPPVAVATHLVHYLLALPVLLAAIVISTGTLHITVAAVPVVVAVQFSITVGPVYLLAALNVRFRDVSHLVAVVLLPLFYATPVFYRASRVPDRFREWYDLNPMVHVIESYRAALLDGAWPAWGPLALIMLSGLLLTLLGHRFFAARAHGFAEEL